MNENELTGLLESLRRMGSDDLNVEVKESATTLSATYGKRSALSQTPPAASSYSE